MAQTAIKLEPEVCEIFEQIDSSQNFLLSGGAGSGKTYSLVQVIGEMFRRNTSTRIACLTYTNAAVKEIKERIQNPNLIVSTIHEFFWDNIKSFQNELRSSLIELINDPEVKLVKSPDGEVDSDYLDDKKITYKEYTLMREGVISHNEVIILAAHMFKTYSKLCDIFSNKYPFIFVDEYQDTSPYVIEILFQSLLKANRQPIIGCFGDSMQSIYEDGIGDLVEYIHGGVIKEIQKKENRRNPKLVFEFGNRLRTDGLVQKASEDLNAPNMIGGEVIDGEIKFYYSNKSDDQIDALKGKLGWDFTDSVETKELNLTHNLIADKAGFHNLMNIYDGDKILEYKKRITDYIKKHQISIDLSDKTFRQIIDELIASIAEEDKKAVLPTPGQKTFIDDNPTLYETALGQNFESFRKLYVDKDQLLDDIKSNEGDESVNTSKRDNLIRHLFKIQENLNDYHIKDYNSFLRKTEYEIKSIKDKKKIREVIKALSEMNEKLIGEVIAFADSEGICKIDDKLNSFINKKKYIYDRVMKVKYGEFKSLYEYLEGYTPFSTQHKIKGDEFNNVLVILDNGNWNSYNFEYLFNEGIFDTLTAAKKKSFPKILMRSKKLFYVCCTRAKKHLAVYFHAPSDAIIENAKIWFGEENVLEI